MLFPLEAGANGFQINFSNSAAYVEDYLFYASQMPLFSFAQKNVYLFNLLYMLYCSFFIAALDFFAFSVSLFFRKSGILIIGIPMVIIIFCSQLLPTSVNPLVLLFISISRVRFLSLFEMFIMPITFLVVAAGLIFLAVRVLRVEL